MVVPGSGLVKAQAEKEGLDKIFINAGFEWRERMFNVFRYESRSIETQGKMCFDIKQKF